MTHFCVPDVSGITMIWYVTTFHVTFLSDVRTYFTTYLVRIDPGFGVIPFHFV